MSLPRLEVICVGTELLSGRVDTHTALIGKALSAAGLEISREHAVGDRRDLMREVFAEAWRRSDVVISAGGLGPTFDDLTRDVWSTVVHRPLIQNRSLVRDIERKFAIRGLNMPPENIRQGFLLQGAKAIRNNFGTAPGQSLRIGRKMLFLLPGPTNELAPMFQRCVMPQLKKTFKRLFSVEKSFHLTGVSESVINHRIEPLVKKSTSLLGCQITHGILASQSVITVKFRVDGRDKISVRRATRMMTAKYKGLLGNIFFGEDDDNLPEVIGRMLHERRRTLAVAESCTGGLLSKMITDVSGASSYFLKGAVTYSNQSKMADLGVQEETLQTYGAVSNEVAKEMALGVKRASGADFGLSITGVAGPKGGTKEKPVGRVHIACAGPKITQAQVFMFGGDRNNIRQRASITALETLRKEIARQTV